MILPGEAEYWILATLLGLHPRLDIDAIPVTSNSVYVSNYAFELSGRLTIHTCHFFSPPARSPAFDGARLAILGSCVLEYSCARAAHTFLCVLKCAFWQSLLQYATL
jgi:hypothetical protein